MMDSSLGITGAVFFPHFHPRFVPFDMSAGIKLLDPGCAKGDEPYFWQPDNLPMDSKDASRFLASSTGFGNQFKDPRELRYFAAAQLEDFYSDTSMAIRDELKGKMNQTVDDRTSPGRKYQMILVLGWGFEERLLEIEEIEAEVGSTMDRLETILGSGLEEPPVGRDMNSSVVTPTVRSAFMGLRDQLLRSFLYFLPSDRALFFSDTEIYDMLKERGVTFSSLPQEDLSNKLKWLDLPGGKMMHAHAQCTEILGQSTGKDREVFAQKKAYLLYFQPPENESM